MLKTPFWFISMIQGSKISGFLIVWLDKIAKDLLLSVYICQNGFCCI